MDPESLVSKFTSQLPALHDMVRYRNEYSAAGCKKQSMWTTIIKHGIAIMLV